ncbi:MAG: hypothetical protein ACJAYU_002991 [Bradymonadia bacterium]
MYRADDRISGTDVAVKLLHEQDEEEAKRFRAEVSLLRLLRLPNVVSLLDDGVHEGRPFLVTALVPGKPFPGRFGACTWDEIERPTVLLLEALARVHANGVVHRDLKPGNVLVGPDGVPYVLDFGVSIGPGFRVEGRSVVGTPAYLSPEQALGRRGDPRSDIYAVGVMLFEALTGSLPHHGESITDILRAKIHEPIDPIATVVAGLPPHVSVAIDSMLSLLPQARPANAQTVLASLGVRPELERVPRLYGEPALQEATDALLRGRNVATGGRNGLGHTRFLRDLAARLIERRVPVWQTRPSTRRWGSLPPEVRSDMFQPAPSLVAERLHAAAKLGRVVIVDDPSKTDHDTLAALQESGARLAFRDDGGLAVSENTHRVPLRPLEARELAELFHGPELVFRLRTDAGSVLFRRTGGVPRRVVTLLGAWIRAGLCHWEDGRIRIPREAIDRLEAGLTVGVEPPSHEPSGAQSSLMNWISVAGPTASRQILEAVDKGAGAEFDALVQSGRLIETPGGAIHATDTLAANYADTGERAEAHRRVAELLSPGSPGRLLHLVHTRSAESLAEEAVAVTQSAHLDGRLGDAFASLREALILLRLLGRASDEYTILRSLVLVAIEMQSARSLDLAIYEAERSEDLGGAAALRNLLDGTRVVRYVERDEGRAEQVAADIPAFPEDLSLEKWRRAARMVAGFGLAPTDHLVLANELLTWAESTGDSDIAASVAGWVGVAHCRCGEFAEAGAMHERAAGVSGARARGIALCNAVSAWIEAGDFTRAQRGVTEAQSQADKTRDTYVGGRALWQSRDLVHRSTGVPPERNEEVLEAIRATKTEAVRCKSLEVEAVAAWRRGDTDAASLAAEAAAAYAMLGQTGSNAMMRALELSIRGGGVEDELQVWTASCAGYPPTELQVLRLLEPLLNEDSKKAWRSRISEIVECVNMKPNNWRLEVLTVAECLGTDPNPEESQ